MNLTYLASPKWRKYFGEHAVHFYVVPVLIIAAVTALFAQPIKGVGLAVFYVTGIVNIWHHSKQNWGILAMIDRIRGRNVSSMMKPLCYAWIFFIMPTLLQYPEIEHWAGQRLLYNASLVCLGAFVLYYGYTLWKSDFVIRQDGIVLTAALALFFYFVPLLFMREWPWLLTATVGAHALQYYLIVFSSLSLSNRKASKSIWAGAALTFLVMALLTAASIVITKTGWGHWDDVWLRTVFGVYVGVTLTHFWVDAFIWKFHNPEIRKLHGEAFNF